MEHIEIALYGKGGIGKSTVSANMSAALAKAGAKVLQIGCDPKHDSTRLLMGGRSIPTVLDYLRDVQKDQAQIDHILHEGSFGIGCIEAGGPKPGVGCAGRGIISAFEFLERNEVKSSYDVVVYDVLGDVVCGGFAVPMRREYADAIFLVTSGEFMALYAANNILRGIRNYDGSSHRRVAGIILNARNLTDEEDRVKRFAHAVGLPIVAFIPRSHVFAEAEQKNCTLIEFPGKLEEEEPFVDLAKSIVDGLVLHEARPLSDEALEDCVLNRTGAQTHQAETNTSPSPSKAFVAPSNQQDVAMPNPAQKPPITRPALYGCAFNGALTTAIHLTDAIVIAHSPRACAFYTWQNISSPGRKNLFHRGILMPSSLCPNLECTEIGQNEAVFGGTELLHAHVRNALERKPGAVIVVTSCVSGIIGDDAFSIRELSTPQTPVVVIEADGDIEGDYMEGIRMCLNALAEQIVDVSTPRKERCVNLIGEVGVANDLELNHLIMKNLLERMGVSINCRFLGDTTTDELRSLAAAPLNILASDGQDNQELREFLENRFGCEFFDGCMPVGFTETKRFLKRIGKYFGCPEAADPIVQEAEELYKDEITRLRPQLEGKRILLTTINVNLDWLLDAAQEVGAEVVWIGVLNYLHRSLGVSDHPERQGIIEEIATLPQLMDKITSMKPDIVMSNFAFAIPQGDYVVDNMPMVQEVGFHSGIRTLERWASLQENGREGAWVNDRELFEKHFS